MGAIGNKPKKFRTDETFEEPEMLADLDSIRRQAKEEGYVDGYKLDVEKFIKDKYPDIKILKVALASDVSGKLEYKEGFWMMSVAYVDAALQKQIDKVKRFLSDLKKEGVDFRFYLLEDYRHYIKPKEYKPEGECRMMVKTGHHDGWFIHSENGIMTPYIEAKLVNAVNYEKEGIFPYKLSKVILGPKFKEEAINKTQIRMMCMERGWWDVEIVESEIKSYR